MIKGLERVGVLNIPWGLGGRETLQRKIDEFEATLRTAENEKSVMVIDEEKYAKELFEICEYPNPEKWEETEEWNREVWRKRASIISKNAKSFMRIEKD